MIQSISTRLFDAVQGIRGTGRDVRSRENPADANQNGELPLGDPGLDVTEAASDRIEAPEEVARPR